MATPSTRPVTAGTGARLPHWCLAPIDRAWHQLIVPIDPGGMLFADLHMPPEEQLIEDQIALVRRWVDSIDAAEVIMPVRWTEED